MDSEKVSMLAKTGNDEAVTTTTPPYNVALTAETTAPTTSSNAESSMAGQGTTSSRIQISTNRIMVAPNGGKHNSNINSRSRSNTNKENQHELNSTIGTTSSASACKDIHVSSITAAAAGGGGGGGTTNQESNLETTSKTVQNRVSSFSSQQSLQLIQQPVEAAKSSKFVIRKPLHQKKLDPSSSSPPSKQGTNTATTTNGNTASSFDGGTTNRMIVKVIAPKGPMKLKLRRLNNKFPSNTNNSTIVVRDIDPQSPLLNKVFPGDILLSVDGQKYDTFKELVDYIKATGSSQHVLEISRQQQQQKQLPTKQDINTTTKVSPSSLPVTKTKTTTTTTTTTAATATATATAAIASLLTTNSSKDTKNNHSHDSQNNVVAVTADEKSNIAKKRISSPQDFSNHPKKLQLQLSSPSGSNNDPIHKRNVEIESSLRNGNKNDKEKQRTVVPATAAGKNSTTNTTSSSSSSSSSTDVADEPKKNLLHRRQLSSPNFSATITNSAGMYPEKEDQTASSNAIYEGSSSSSNVAVSDKMDKEQRIVLSTDIPPSKSTICTNTAAMDLHLPSVNIITPGRGLSLSTNLSDRINNVASRNNGEIAPTDPQHYAMEPTKKNQSTFLSGRSPRSAASCSSSSCGDEKSKHAGIGILKTSKSNDGETIDEAKIRTMTTRGINENGGEQAAREEEEKEKGYNSDDVVVAAWPGPPPSATGITMPPRRKRPAGKTLVWYRRHKPEVFDNIPSIINIQPDSEEDSVGTASGRKNEKGTAAAQSHTRRDDPVSSGMMRIEDTFAESSDEEEDAITALPSRKKCSFSLSNIVTSPSLADTVKMRRRERKRRMNEISDKKSSHNTGAKSINESRRKKKRKRRKKVESQNHNNISVKETSIKVTKRERGRPMKDESQNSNLIIEETTLVDTPPNTKRGRSPKEISSNTTHPSYDIDYQATMIESDDAAVLVNRFEAQDFKDKRLAVGSKVYAAFPGIEPSDEPYYWGIISAKEQIEGTWKYRIDFDDGDIIDEVTSAAIMRMDEAYKLYKCTDGVDVLKPPKTYIVDYYSQGPMTMTELQENACGICSQCQTRAPCGNCLICVDADVDNNSIMNQCCFHKMCRHIIIPRKAQSLPGYLPESWIFYFDDTAANPTKQGLMLLTKEEAKRLPSRGKHVVKPYKSFEDAASLYPDVFSPFDASSFYRAIGIPDGTISTRIRNQMAEALSHGDWVLFSSNDETEPLWLGRVLSSKEFEGKCTWTNNTGDDKIMSESTLIGSHEVALNVIWYERTGVGPRLEYHLSREHPCSCAQNNNNLVHAKFDMQKMQGRDTNRMSLPDLSHLQNSLKDWYIQEYPLVWRMDQAVYDYAIGECALAKQVARQKTTAH